MATNRKTWLLCEVAVALVVATSAVAQETPFQSRQLTPSGEYTFGIEGPAVDARGNLYVVNFGKPGTIGKLRGAARGQRRQRDPLRFGRPHVRRRLQEAQYLPG